MANKKIGSIHPPEKPKNLPKNAQWLSGQGAGTWFTIEEEGHNQYRIKRFTPTGEIDCNRIFQLEDNSTHFDIEESYQFTHVSHCAKCRIEQRGIVFTFHYIEN